MPSITPNPHSSDGQVYAQGSSWAAAHDASSGAGVNSTNTMMAVIAYGTTDDYESSWSVGRCFLAFDTTLSGSVSSATLALVMAKTFYSHADSGIALVASTAASATALVADDYDQAGATLLAPALLHADIGTSYGSEVLTLNAAGLAHINTAGYTKFALRENHYDLGDVAPSAPYYDYDGGMYWICAQDNATPSYRPLLTVEYTEESNPGPDEVTAEMSGENRLVEWSAVTGASAYTVERSVGGAAREQVYP